MATKFILEGDSPKLIEDPPKRKPILGEGELEDEFTGKMGGHISAQLEGKRDVVKLPMKFIVESLMGEKAFKETYEKMGEDYKKGLDEEVYISAPLHGTFSGIAGLASIGKEKMYTRNPITKGELFSSDIFINPNLIDSRVGNQASDFFKELSPEERKSLFKETVLHEIRHKLVSNIFGKTSTLPKWVSHFIAETPSGNSLTEVHSYAKDFIGNYNELLQKKGKKPVNVVGEENAIGITKNVIEKYLDYMHNEQKKRKLNSKQMDDLYGARSLYMILEVLDEPEVLEDAPLPEEVKKSMIEELAPYKKELNYLLKNVVQVKDTKDGPMFT